MDGQRIIDGLEDALAYMNGSATQEDYEIHGKPPMLTPSKPSRYNLSRRKKTKAQRPRGMPGKCITEKAMSPSLLKLVETAMENQPYILEQDLKNGGPLCYYDKEGAFVIQYPDGTIEHHDTPCPPNPEHCVPARDHRRA